MTIEPTDIITITRLWHHPEIHVYVSTVGVNVTMSLADFIAALKTEAGSTEDTIDKAAERVVYGMKEETRKV